MYSGQYEILPPSSQNLNRPVISFANKLKTLPGQVGKKTRSCDMVSNSPPRLMQSVVEIHECLVTSHRGQPVDLPRFVQLALGAVAWPTKLLAPVLTPGFFASAKYLELFLANFGALTS